MSEALPEPVPKTNEPQFSAAEQLDREFVTFTHPSYGVRALGRVLTSYSKRGIATVAGLIGTWAPSIENNTSAYVSAVCRALGVEPDQVIDVRAYLPRLASAIIKHENGAQPFSLVELSQWVYMA